MKEEKKLDFSIQSPRKKKKNQRYIGGGNRTTKTKTGRKASRELQTNPFIDLQSRGKGKWTFCEGGIW